MKSTRFPGKPLALINGKPMLAHVVEQCAKSVKMSEIIVATESQEIVQFCEQNFINYFLTKEHETGSDRIAEVNATLSLDYVINVQGDEPLFNYKDVNLAIERIESQKVDLLVGYTHIDDMDDWRDPNTIKVVLNSREKIIYMSRAPIPGNKVNAFKSAFRSVNLYGYSRESLEYYSKTKRSLLELAEDHELLRFLDSSFEIQGILMSNSSVPVDIPEDLKLVESIIQTKLNP
jgi:3-deoxy-manno-octulosonate cytidylyltransferase (CMP-KDO synthetase)